ncbi:MAG: hypothetical protein JXP73_02810 [Deltaproteobacteria bacterium]|nr:hypothetical protein [Deltaproteobacteria bacterium]
MLCLVALLPACKDDAYAVVSVLTFADSVSGVAQFRVHVHNDSAEDTLVYPREATESLTLDTSHPVTFSVQFGASRGGPVTFEVEALDAAGATLGYGTTSGTIEQGKVFRVTVLIVVGALRPVHGLDGGTLTCDPYAPAVACGPGQTCGLLCGGTEPAVGMCYAAGAGAPGDACASNNDCAPGSQCFTLSALGCSVMTCLRFCDHDDAACAETGSFCNVPIACGSTPPFAACSRPCDPTGSGTVGCAAGLACFIYADETTDCACAGLGAAGAACTQNHGCNGEPGCGGCRAGLSCIVPAGSASGVCRPICDLNLAAAACPTGTTCNPFAGSTRGQYGFCE